MQPSLGYLSQSAGGRSNYLSTPQPSPQSVSKGNFWLSQLPSALAAGASFIPGVGSVVAGGLGAVGEAARQSISGEDLNLDKIAGEGALSAIPFGLGKAAKLVKGGVEAAKGINVTTKGLETANAAEKVAAPVTSAVTSTPSLLSKMSSNLEGGARGIKPGATATGQEQLGVQGANDLNQFLNDVGVRGTNARGQLSKLEQLHTGWGKQLDDLIKEGNQTLPPTSISAVKDAIASHLGQIAGLPKAAGETALVDASGKALITAGKDVATHPYITDLYGDLGKVTDLQGLNKLRQRIDDTINYGRKAATPDPQKEQIAQAFRRGINDFVGEALPEAKGVAGLMSKSYDAQDFLKNAAKNPKGLGRILGVPVIPGEAAQTIGAKAGQVAAGAAPTTNGLMGALKTGANYGGALAGQEATRAVAGAVVPPDPSAVPDQTQVEPTLAPSLPTDGAPVEAPPGGITDEQMSGLLAQAMNAPDAKSQAALLDNFSKLAAARDKLSARSSKPVSSATNQQIANATSGLQQISRLRNELSTDPGLPNKNAGASLLGNFGRSVAGTQAFNTAKNEIVDVLARLRTGAAISKQEEAQYKSMLPTAFDTPDTVNQKLSTYEQLFQGILERSKGGSPALETAGVTQQ